MTHQQILTELRRWTEPIGKLRQFQPLMAAIDANDLGAVTREMNRIPHNPVNAYWWELVGDVIPHINAAIRKAAA